MINKEVFDSDYIPYNLFKVVENIIIKKIKCINHEN